MNKKYVVCIGLIQELREKFKLSFQTDHIPGLEVAINKYTFTAIPQL
jgi:hypothetical protein